MSFELILTAPAREDIQHILSLSEQKFGIAAEARYSDLIWRTLAAIQQDPERGRPLHLKWIRGARSLHLRSLRLLQPSKERVAKPRHFVIYFVLDGERVLISRILHDAMDIDHQPLPNRLPEL